MKRKFAVSTVTSVRCEQKLIELADAMDIPLSDALTKGILYTAEFKLENEPARYSSATHDLFIALQKKNLAELEEWLGIQKIHQRRIAELAEMQAEKDRPKPLIWVWDNSVEETRQIPEDQYDKSYMIKKPAPKRLRA